MNPAAVIFEPSPYGHRLAYVREMVLGLREAGVRPLWVTSRLALESEEYRIFLADLSGGLESRAVDLPPLPVDRQGFRAMAARIVELPELDPFDFVYLPSGEGIAQYLGMMSRWPGQSRVRQLLARSEILLLGGQFGYPAKLRRRVRNRISAWSIRPHLWGAVFHLDPFQFGYLSRRAGSSWQLMPDPVGLPETERDRSTARAALGLATDGKLLAATGWLERSKGIDRLMEAFALAVPRLPPGTRLMLAGRFRDGLAEEARERYPQLLQSGQLILRDGLLGETELELVLQACDLVCLPYLRALQSSGIFLKAVAHRVPVLAHAAGWLERTVRLLENGWLVDVTDLPGFADKMVEAVHCSGNPAVWSDRIGVFLGYHSVDNFRAVWTRRIRRRMGIADRPGLVEWSTVAGA